MYKVICQDCGHSKTYNTTFRKKNPIHSCFNCGGENFTIEIGHNTLVWEVDKRLFYNKGEVSSPGVYSPTQMEWFRAYRQVQNSGKFNMVTEATEACIEAKLSLEQYRFVMENYEGLKDQGGEKV